MCGRGTTYSRITWLLSGPSESNFGNATGGFSVLEALATLAYDPRRAEFFREQLLTALQILDDGHINPTRMTGSWAGAMGQLQFLPTIFRNYAVDGDGDGRADIWNSLPDVFYSAANFISQSGWRGDERWGREVVLPDGFDYELVGARNLKPLNEWRGTRAEDLIRRAHTGGGYSSRGSIAGRSGRTGVPDL